MKNTLKTTVDYVLIGVIGFLPNCTRVSDCYLCRAFFE
jgi:hypothetical protein